MSGNVFDEESFSEEEDESFLGDPVEGSKPSRLGDLFGAQNSTGQGNTSLQYTAPKQPHLKELGLQEPGNKDTGSSRPETPTAGQPKVVFASTVHAFLLKDGQFTPQGKIGLALLSSARGKQEAQLLLYHSNKQPLAQAAIGPDFVTEVQKGNYALVRDDKNNQWSLAFGNHSSLVTFVQWVLAIRSSFLADHHKQILSVDVVEGEGNCVSSGDFVEMEYLEYLIEAGPSFTEFNGNMNSGQSLKVKIGRGKVPKGWEEGMIGMKKGGKRLFVIPPDIGYAGHDSSPTFPTDAPLMVLVHVKRVKFSSRTTPPAAEKEKQQSRQSLERKSSFESDTSGRQESPAPSTGQRITQPISNRETDENAPICSSKKADLVSRMARIGQPMIPILSPPNHTSSTKGKENGIISTSASILPDIQGGSEDSTVDSTRRNSRERPPIATKVIKPLPVVCADLTLSRNGSLMSTTTTTTTVKGSAEGKVPESTSRTGPSTSGPAASTPIMPIMYPYPHHAYFMPTPAASLSARGVVFTSADVEDDLADRAPPRYTMAMYGHLPPYHHPMVPAGIAQVESSWAPAEKEHLEEHSKEIIDEIRKSNIHIENFVEKFFNQSIEALKNQISEIKESLSEDSRWVESEDFVEKKRGQTPATTADNNLDSVLEKMNSTQEQVPVGSSKLESSDTVEEFSVLRELLNKVENLNESVQRLSAAGVSPENKDSNSLLDSIFSLESKIDNLQAEVSRETEWKEKYEKLKSQALQIKDKYEERISLLTEQLHRAQIDATDRVGEEAKIKKIMSQFYKSASSKFAPEERYDSEEVKQVIFEAIKTTTLQVLGGSSSSDLSPEESLTVSTSPELYSLRISPITVKNSVPEYRDTATAATLTREKDRSDSPSSREGSVQISESMESFYSAEPTPDRELGRIDEQDRNAAVGSDVEGKFQGSREREEFVENEEKKESTSDGMGEVEKGGISEGPIHESIEIEESHMNFEEKHKCNQVENFSADSADLAGKRD